MIQKLNKNKIEISSQFNSKNNSPSPKRLSFNKNMNNNDFDEVYERHDKIIHKNTNNDENNKIHDNIIF